MFLSFKLGFDVDSVAILGLATVLATFHKMGHILIIFWSP
jgi:hypothetical protein